MWQYMLNEPNTSNNNNLNVEFSAGGEGKKFPYISANTRIEMGVVNSAVVVIVGLLLAVAWNNALLYAYANDLPEKKIYYEWIQFLAGFFF